MRTLYTLAYPALGERDMLFIEQTRAVHDAAMRELVAPHFTLVFGSSSIAETAYLHHVDSVARNIAPIDVTCRQAIVSPGTDDMTMHVFLVPKEGFRELSLLHSRLYAGPLAAELRADIPFIPHITVGTFTHIAKAQALCDALNAQPMSIEGRVEQITVAALENHKLEKLAQFKLAAA